MSYVSSSIPAEVFRIIRLKNSPDGNPRYDIYTSKGTFRTQNDSHAAYQNPEAWVGKTITLHLSDHGQVSSVDLP